MKTEEIKLLKNELLQCKIRGNSIIECKKILELKSENDFHFHLQACHVFQISLQNV